MSLSSIYDKRYAVGYRGELSGYEVARWAALQHFISKVVKPAQVNTVLDYGAGSGLHVGLWEKLFPAARLSFCDISSVARQQFEKKYPDHVGGYQLIDELQPQSFNNSFDMIVSVEVMEHVEDLSGYLRDIYRLLKPGGYFVWTTPCANRFSIEYIVSLALGKIEQTPEGYRRWTWEDPTHLRRLRSNEAAKCLEHVGFQGVQFRFRSHLFSFLCTCIPSKRAMRFREYLMKLDYSLFRRLPNGASMIGLGQKPT
jgi:SAM-dependent methyltransferase